MRGQRPRPTLPAVAAAPTHYYRGDGCAACANGYLFVRSGFVEDMGPVRWPALPKKVLLLYEDEHRHSFRAPEPDFDAKHCVKCHDLGARPGSWTS